MNTPKMNQITGKTESQEERCADYYSMAYITMNSIGRGELRRTDKMYIVSVERRNGKVVIDDREEKEVCYNPIKLSKHGWCYLNDFPEKHEDEMKNKRDKWNEIPSLGICSEGCDTT